MRVTVNFVSNMKRKRASAGWTQQQLAERLEALGFKISRQTIANIEVGKVRASNLTLDEAMAISCALSTPLTAMILPVRADEEAIEVGDHMTFTTWRMFEWLRCQEPLDSDDLWAWSPAVAPFRAYDRLRRAQIAAQEAYSRRLSILVRTADEQALDRYDVASRRAKTGRAQHRADEHLRLACLPELKTSRAWSLADSAYEEALRALAVQLETLRDLDLEATDLLAEGYLEDMKRLGIGAL